MTRRRRLLIVPAVIVVVVVATAFVAAKILLSSDRLVAIIKSQAAAELGVEPTVSSAHFGFLDGLTIDDFAFERPAGDIRVAFACPQIRVKFVFSSFFSGDPKPDSIEMTDPAVRVRIGEVVLPESRPGEPNGLPLGPIRAAVREKLLDLAALGPHVPQVHLADMTVAVEEEPTGRVFEMAGINLSLRRDKSGVVDVEATLEDPDLGALELTGEWNIPAASARVRFSAGTIVISESFANRVPVVVGRKLIDAGFRASIKVDLFADADGNASDDEDVLSFGGKIAVDDLFAHPGELAYPVGRTSARVSIDNGVATIEKIAGFIDDGLDDKVPCPMTVTGKVVLDKPKLDYRLDVVLEHFNIDRRMWLTLLPWQVDRYRVADPIGYMKLVLTVTPPANPEIDSRPFMDGTMHVRDVTFNIRPRVGATGEWSKGVLVMPHLAGTIETTSGALREAMLKTKDANARQQFELSGQVLNLNIKGALLFDIFVKATNLDLATEVTAMLTRRATIKGFEQWGPKGTVDVELEFRKLHDDPDRVIILTADIHELSILPKVIDYQIEGIYAGHVSLNTEKRELKIEGIKAAFDDSTVSIDAHMRKLKLLKLDVTGENLAIDDKLRDALYDLDRQKAEKEKEEGADAKEEKDGNDERAEGEAADATQEASKPSLLDDLPPLRELWDSINPRGRVDVELKVRRDNIDAKAAIAGTVKIRHAGIYAPLLPFPLSDIQGGEAELADGVVEVRNIVAREGNMVLTLDGRAENILEGDLSKIVGVLSLSAERFRLDDVRKLIADTVAPLAEDRAEIDAQKISDMWDRFSPEGEVDVFAKVTKLPGEDPLESIDVALDIKIREADLCYRGKKDDPKGFDITDVRGSLHVAGLLPRVIDVPGKDGAVEKLELPGRSAAAVALTANHGPATAKIDAVGQIGDDGPSFEVKLDVFDVPIDAEVMQFIGDEEVRKTIEKIGPTGRVALSLEAVGLLGDEKALSLGLKEGKAAKLALKDGAVTIGLVLRDISGVAVVERLDYREGKLTVKGRILSDRMSVKQVEARNLSVDFSLTDASGAEGSRQFLLTGLTGDFYGGKISGAAKIDIPVEGFRCGLDLHLDGGDMASFLQSVIDYQRGDFQGVVNGDILLQSDGLDPADLHGRGKLELTGGKLWEQPTLLKVFNLLNLAPGDQYAFRGAELDIRFGRDTIYVDDMRLLGRGMTIFGKGQVRNRKELDLVFVLGSGTEMPIIPLIEGFKQQMVNVRVRGDVNDPDVRIYLVAPIAGPLSDFMDELLKDE